MVSLKTPKMKVFTTGSALSDTKHFFLAWWPSSDSPEGRNPIPALWQGAQEAQKTVSKQNFPAIGHNPIVKNQ